MIELKKENQVIKILPHGKEFILSAHRKFINNSPQTLRLLMKLQRQGWQEKKEVKKIANLFSWVKLILKTGKKRSMKCER